MPEPAITLPPCLIFNKNGLTARTEAWQMTLHTLQVEYTPNKIALIGFILSSILTGIFIYLRLDTGYFSGLAWLVFGYELFTSRQIRCELDTLRQTVEYTRFGWAGLPWGRQEITCQMGDIAQIELQRHIRSGGDTFQVVLWLFGFKRYNLTHDDLTFSECQRLAELIRDFVDPELPISAVD